MPIIVGALAETVPGERRAAIDPLSVERLVASGASVLVENEAGSTASFPDEQYQKAGATPSTRKQALSGCTVLAVVRSSDATTASAMAHQYRRKSR